MGLLFVHVDAARAIHLEFNFTLMLLHDRVGKVVGFDFVVVIVLVVVVADKRFHKVTIVVVPAVSLSRGVMVVLSLVHAVGLSVVDVSVTAFRVLGLTVVVVSVWLIYMVHVASFTTVEILFMVMLLSGSLHDKVVLGVMKAFVSVD